MIRNNDLNMKVVMLLANPLEIDARVCNEAKALQKAGYEVTVFMWDREQKYSAKKVDLVCGVNVRRIFVRATYGKGLRQIFSFNLFWLKIFFNLLLTNFYVVHCHDFDTLLPGFLAAKLKGRKVVYDSHENYPAAMLDRKTKRLAALVEKIESFIIKRVDLVITVSSPISEILKIRGAKNVKVIITAKDIQEFNPPQKEVEELKTKLNIKGKFIFLYIGLLYWHRNLLEIVNIFKKYVTENILFIIGGYGELEEAVKKEAEDCKNIMFIGKLMAKDIPLYTKAADVLFAVNKDTSLNSALTIPNKLFEAIAAGKPIIGSNVGPLGQIIKETGCGIAVNPDDLDEIRNAIIKIIYDKEAYNLFANNAIKAQEKYNWENTAKELIQEYKKL